MLRATKVSAWSSAYELNLDGMPVTRWDPSWWRSGGSFTVQGQQYRVRSNAWGNEFTMTDLAGNTVATAGKVNRREWTVIAGGREYAFRRTSWWRHQFDLLLDGRRAGFVRRPSSWRSTVDAELAAMPLTAQIFTVAVALTTWDNANAAAAGASDAT